MGQTSMDFATGDTIRMSTRKMIGISLMVALGGAFIAWNIQVAASSQQMIVSALLAGAIFAAWRFLVWQPPRKR